MTGSVWLYDIEITQRQSYTDKAEIQTQAWGSRALAWARHAVSRLLLSKRPPPQWRPAAPQPAPPHGPEPFPGFLGPCPSVLAGGAASYRQSAWLPRAQCREDSEDAGAYEGQRGLWESWGWRHIVCQAALGALLGPRTCGLCRGLQCGSLGQVPPCLNWPRAVAAPAHSGSSAGGQHSVARSPSPSPIMPAVICGVSASGMAECQVTAQRGIVTLEKLLAEVGTLSRSRNLPIGQVSHLLQSQESSKLGRLL